MAGTDPLRPRVVCAYCLRRNLRFRRFCRRCNAPLCDYATTGPIEQVVTTGYAYRRSTDPHIPTLVLVGWWVHMGLSTVVGSGVIAGGLVPVGLLDGGPTMASQPPAALTGAMQAFAMALVAGIMLLHAVFLAKLTWRYFHQPTYDRSPSPPGDSPPSESSGGGEPSGGEDATAS